MRTSKSRTQKERENHPIRLVRKFYARCGFRHLGTAAGFARMVGCSDSLIRNTESGIIPFSNKLAQRIENATGVSATWLLETVAGLQRGGDVSSARILGSDGLPWYPARDSKFHFTDELIDAAEMAYLISPANLPPLMGAIMEAFLEVEPPRACDRPLTNAHHRKEMRKYVDTFLRPVLRLVGELEEDARKRFLDVFMARLDARDAATSSELLDFWKLIFMRQSVALKQTPRSTIESSRNSSEEPAPRPSKGRAQKRCRSK